MVCGRLGQPLRASGQRDGCRAERYQAYLRQLYRRDPGPFLAWARDASKRDVTLLGDDVLTAVLYDALCQVARSIGLDIGEPLKWTDAE